MDITIIALGSHGDVLPYIALGAHLHQAGHSVCFATFENFKSLVLAQDLTYHQIEGDAQAILGSISGQEISKAGRNVVRLATAIMQSFGALAERYARDLTGLSARPTDLIVNQLPAGLYGLDLAEKLQVPLVLASVIPLIPTSTQPMLAFPPQFSRLPGYNLATHWIAYQIVWQGFRRTINRWRREQLQIGNAPFWGALLKNWGEIPVLNGFSPHVVPRPPDWGEHIHLTGYWFPDPPDWDPPKELLRFLEQGPPPVFLGFGSMPIPEPRKVTRLIIESLQKTGQRGILQAGWGGLGDMELPDDVYLLDYAPYRWLFPQTAAIVHHGGSGTTAHGLRSGVPNLVIPFTFDQFYWGARVHALGVGPKPIPFRKLTPLRLAEGITHAISDPDMPPQAKHLAVKIKADKGLRQAVRIIEGINDNNHRD